MIHGTCDACKKPITRVVTETSVLVQLEAPTVIVEEDTGEEFEEGGKFIELRVVDGDGEPTGEHFCPECAIYAIASSHGPDESDDNDDDDDGGSEESEPVAPSASGKKGK